MDMDQIRRRLRDLDSEKQGLEAQLVSLALEKQDSGGGSTAAATAPPLGPGAPNHCGFPWSPRGSCGYCGSMGVREAILRLKTPGTRYSGADWKYGWPHKFYIGSAYPFKFYNIHLNDASQAEFAEFNQLSQDLFGVAWTFAPVGDPPFASTLKLTFKASSPGIQLAGIVP